MANTELARGWKKAKAIEIIESNLDKDFFEVSDMIGQALDLNKYASRAYYKYMVKHGLISRFASTDTPWKSAKSAQKATKAPKAKAEKASYALVSGGGVVKVGKITDTKVVKTKSAAAPTNSAGDFLSALAAEATRSKAAKTKAA